MVENAALRAIRLLDLVPYIVAHPGISITELAKEFSISRDEVLKDLNLLFLCGLPGYTPLELIDISFDEESVVIRDPQNLAAPRNLNESEALIARIALAALEESHTEAELVEQAESPQAEALATELLLEQFPLQEGESAAAAAGERQQRPGGARSPVSDVPHVTRDSISPFATS